LATNARVPLVEPYASDNVEDNINPFGRPLYSASTTICCAHSISDGGKLMLGAQAGERRLADVFAKAGFKKFRKAMQTPFNYIFEATL